MIDGRMKVRKLERKVVRSYQLKNSLRNSIRPTGRIKQLVVCVTTSFILKKFGADILYIGDIIVDI